MSDRLKVLNAALGVLADIQMAHPDSVIGGGFLRDVYLGHDPKDLDIFVFAKNTAYNNSALQQLIALKSALSEIGYKSPKLDEDKFYPLGEGGTEVTGVIEPYSIGVALGIPMQVIMVDGYDRSNVLERFDYGICRLMCDREKVTFHPHFHRDRADKSFRLCRRREEFCLNSSVERYARFKSRPEFQDWHFMHYCEPIDPNGEINAHPHRRVVFDVRPRLAGVPIVPSCSYTSMPVDALRRVSQGLPLVVSGART